MKIVRLLKTAAAHICIICGIDLGIVQILDWIIRLWILQDIRCFSYMDCVSAPFTWESVNYTGK